MPRPQVIAHRGASVAAPENTRAAFDLAIQLGADALEFDVQMTADGQLVVMHDDTLERTAWRNGAPTGGAICDLDYEDLALCDVGSWFNEAFPAEACDTFVGLCPMRLEDVIERYGGWVDLFIELKRLEDRPGLAERAIEVIRSRDDDRRTIHVLSTDAQSLIKMRVQGAELRLIQLLPHRGQWPLTVEEIARYADGIGPLRSMISEGTIAAAKENGLSIYPYTINDPLDMEQMFARGIDGVITDVPAEGKKALYRTTKRRSLVSA